MTTHSFLSAGRRIGRVALLTAGVALAPLMAPLSGATGMAALAQNAEGNLFAPRIWVNDDAITEYEIAQRAQFLRLLGAPVDYEVEALKVLTEDRLRLQEAGRVGLKLSPEQITAGMEEFASRANLPLDQFLGALEQGGVAEETFRDFVEAGAVWRDVVRARFAQQVQVTEAEVDEVLNGATRDRPLRLRLSELVIPMPESGDGAETRALAERLSDEISGEGAFASAARRYSKSPTAGGGGRLDWMPLANLPPQIAAQVLALDAGQVSDPVYIQGAAVLFYLHEIGSDPAPAAKPIGMEVEYAEYLIVNTSEEIARVRSVADTCLDLYGDAKGKPANLLQVKTAPMGSIPNDVGLELAKLDPGEASVALTRGTARLFLMLCNRKPVTEEPISREAVRDNILNRKIEGLSENYLEELRHAAFIRQP